jgi:GH24 family phage-related lysozyme (muramidase)
MNIVGNKGGVAYSFQLKNRLFNFIAAHLRHGQSKEAERDQMAQQLVSQMKMQELQTHIPGLESDAIADFCFFFGDLNYRLNTNYASLNNTNIQNAIPMIPKFD